MFSSKFLKRLGEEAVHSFIAGGAAAMLAAGDGLGKAAALAAVVAGARAVLGVLVSAFGASDSPSVGG
jgi:hypothetical protein